MSEGLIYQKISEIMNDVPAISKDKKNVSQGFSFRGIDDVMNVMKPIFSKHKVFTTFEVVSTEKEKVVTKSGAQMQHVFIIAKVKYFAEDGSFIETITSGEGMDSGDKATNKAMSIAYKYAMFLTFCIPTEDMPDPDLESHEIVNKNVENVTKVFGKPAQDKKVTVLFQEFYDYVGKNRSYISADEMKTCVTINALYGQGKLDYDKLNNYFILIKNSVEGLNLSADEAIKKVDEISDDQIPF